MIERRVAEKQGKRQKMAVECAVARCSQERRACRRDLQRWGKSLLFAVGLERVAQELMGGRRWRKLTGPFHALEKKEPEDWTPNEACYFCKNKSHSSSTCLETLIHSDEQGNTETESNTNANDASCTCTPGNQCSSCEGLTPACNGDGTEESKPPATGTQQRSLHADQPLDLSLHSRHKVQPIRKKEQLLEAGDDCKPVIKVPQPSTARTGKRGRVESNSTWKRTYTEEELQAALRDIQSGKLGTRRAAVIYGIPRSTLRNKVYKLALDRSNGKRKPGTSTPTAAVASCSNKSSPNLKPKPSDQTSTKPEKTREKEKSKGKEGQSKSENSPASDGNCNSASESLKLILKQAITQRANNSSSGSRRHPSSSASKSDPSPHLSNLFGDPFSAITMLSNIDSGTGPLFSQFLLNVQQLALGQRVRELEVEAGHSLDEAECVVQVPGGGLPLLPDLIRKLAQERFDIEKAKCNPLGEDVEGEELEPEPEPEPEEELEEEGEGNRHEAEREAGDPVREAAVSGNVILKVPSYKPKTCGEQSSHEKLPPDEDVSMEYENDNDNDDDNQHENYTISSHGCSDVVTKGSRRLSGNGKGSLAGNVRRNLKPVNYASSVNSEESSSDALSINKSLGSRSEKHSNHSNASDHSNPSTPDSKRNRPKRGRYRNYNRDDLAKAVKAVQRGELSVHRAGTLFGVPHSTLEYKVKERHLLRPKKRPTSGSSPQSMLKSEPRQKGPSSTSSPSPSLSIEKKGSSSESSLTGGSNKKTSKRSTTINSHTNNSTNTTNGPSTAAPAPDGALPFWQSALPFFSLESQNNQFFASNMMRKLQENVRLNQEESSQQQNKFGGLLLESLIKSSLEKKSSDEGPEAADEEPTQAKYNVSLAALQEVSALDKRE